MLKTIFIFHALLLLVGTPVVAAAQAPDLQPSPGLYRQHIEFLLDTGQPLDALAAARQQPAKRIYRTGLLSARLSAAAGLPDTARAIMLSGGTGRASSDGFRVWLDIAQAQYAQRDWKSALDSLDQIPFSASFAVAAQQSSLRARIYLRQERYQQAAETLYRSQRNSELSGPDTFNLAVAWFRSGDVVRGAGILDSLGQYSGDKPALAALADQANLTLGFWLLRRGQGRLARAAFSRIRLNGPLAVAGMTGLGWAELRPGRSVNWLATPTTPACNLPGASLGTESEQSYEAFPECETLERAFDGDYLSGAASRGSEQARFLRAAKAWELAAQGDALSVTVQEALVAWPFALWDAGEKAAARMAFRDAAERLGKARQRIRQRLEQVDTNSGLWRDTERPSDIDSNPWLSEFPTPENRHALHRELSRLSQRLQTAQARLQPLERLESLNDPELTARVLRELQTASRSGRKFATPSPAQRGVLIAALRQPAAGGRQNFQAPALDGRLQDVATRLRNTNARLDKLHRSAVLRQTQRRLEFVDERIDKTLSALSRMELMELERLQSAP